MEKGYYEQGKNGYQQKVKVAIHNKNGKGLLHRGWEQRMNTAGIVAIHNKNGKGLLLGGKDMSGLIFAVSQSTIKMEKGYYATNNKVWLRAFSSQSTIKMEKGYYYLLKYELFFHH